MNKVSLLVLPLIFLAGEFALHADINSTLARWNAVASGNLEMVNDIGGATFVGGNITDDNSFTAASVGNSGIPITQDSLAVGGNIESGNPINVNGGSVVVGGTIESGRQINMNSGGSITQNNPSALPPSPISQIVIASQYWATLNANSSTLANGNALNFNCASASGDSLAVFNVSASQIFGQNYSSFFLNPAANTSEVIINVSGGTINWTSGNFLSQFNTGFWQGRVLFNFYNATTVNLSGGQIDGYVVAPNATVTENNDIYGGLMAENIDVNGEINLPQNSTSAWSGDLPNVPVPEASTFVPGMSGLAMLGVIVWQEKRRRGY